MEEQGAANKPEIMYLFQREQIHEGQFEDADFDESFEEPKDCGDEMPFLGYVAEETVIESEDVVDRTEIKAEVKTDVPEEESFKLISVESATSSQIEEEPPAGNDSEFKWCCKKNRGGRMVRCSNPSCPHGIWFHYDVNEPCENYTKEQEATFWFCSKCQTVLFSKKSKESKNKSSKHREKVTSCVTYPNPSDKVQPETQEFVAQYDEWRNYFVESEDELFVPKKRDWSVFINHMFDKYDFVCSFNAKSNSKMSKGNQYGFAFYGSCGGNCKMNFIVYVERPRKYQPLSGIILSRGVFVLKQNKQTGRQLRGSERLQFMKVARSSSAKKLYTESMKKLPENRLQHGNLPYRSPASLRKVKSDFYRKSKIDTAVNYIKLYEC